VTRLGRFSLVSKKAQSCHKETSQYVGDSSCRVSMASLSDRKVALIAEESPCECRDRGFIVIRMSFAKKIMGPWNAFVNLKKKRAITEKKTSRRH
jgi:hypothetical protein